MRALKGGRAFSGLSEAILTEGYAAVHLDPAQTATLSELYEAAMSFFALDSAVKSRYSTPRRNVGYRTYGYAYAQSPEHPDLNDSFLHWIDTREKLSHHDEIEPFLRCLDDYQLIVAQVVKDLVDELRVHYGYQPSLPFEDASFIQVNSFPEEPEHELLQETHEDAVFATVIWASADGLELLLDDDRIVPVTFKPNELLVMPGSVLTDMTGGQIQPLYHRARNHGHADRKSIMYFASPEVSKPIAPFVVTDYNREMDIRERVIKNPQNFFGLSADFITS
jgi:isopenicillin N synthase-like dioxygenase